MKTHYGSIKFSTLDRIEQPYLADIEKIFKEELTKYLAKHKIEWGNIDITINVYNQEGFEVK